MLRQSLLRLFHASQLPANAQASIGALPQLLSRRIPLRHCSAAASSSPVPAAKRLSQIISLSGLCSRRQAENLIRDGQVTVDGERITAPAAVVAADAKIVVDGQPLRFSAAAQPRPRMWMINKLRGELVTDSDERGRASIMDRVKKMGFARGKHLKPVGRLDMNTEGLLLLTTDGRVARALELPANQVKRVYKVRVHGNITEDKLKALSKGFTVDGVRYDGAEVKVIKGSGANRWLLFSCTQGKKHQVKIMLKHMALDVNRLIRVQYGPYKIDGLPAGAAKEVPVTEAIRRLAYSSDEKKKEFFPTATRLSQLVKPFSDEE